MSGDSTLAVVSRLGGAQVEQTVRRVARRLGVNRPGAVALDTVTIPDTAAAVEAANLLRAKAPSVLAAHSHRAYLFGALLGMRDRLGWDAERGAISARFRHRRTASLGAVPLAHQAFTVYGVRITGI